jgi:RNA polymerase sigma factor (sigma-70 family)
MATPIALPSCVRLASRAEFFALYSVLVEPIAESVAQRLPASFDCRDLKHSGYVALLEACPGIEAYLYKRIRGAIVDSVRRGPYRDASEEDTISNLDTLPGVAVSALSSLIDHEQRVAVAHQVAQLPAIERTVIGMRARGASVAAIAANARISPRTVKRRTASAVGMLRAAMAA